jgi:hypothetical protein
MLYETVGVQISNIKNKGNERTTTWTSEMRAARIIAWVHENPILFSIYRGRIYCIKNKQITQTFEENELEPITILKNYLGVSSCHNTLSSPWYIIDAHGHKWAINGSPIWTLKHSWKTLMRTNLTSPIPLWDKWKNQERQFGEDKQFGKALDTIFWGGLQKEHFWLKKNSQLQYAYQSAEHFKSECQCRKIETSTSLQTRHFQM